MQIQHRIIGSRLGLSILLVLILVHAGCGGPIPTPTPTPDTVAIATPVVTILKNPKIPDGRVPVGSQVILAAEATGRNLKIQWSVDKGTLSSPEGPSTIYTAPDEPGSDTVEVVVTSDGGSTTETVKFTVVVPPTETLTLTNTPTVKPTLTKTPTSVPTNTPTVTPTLTKMSTRTPTTTPAISTRSPTATTTAVTSTPTTTVRSVAPSTTMGTLTVKVLEGCSNSFSLTVDDETVGGGKAGAKTVVAVGTYDIILHSYGSAPIKRGVIIREGKETVVDFTQDLGIFLLTTYPQLKKPLVYRLYSPDDENYGRELLDPGPSDYYFVIGGVQFAVSRWSAFVEYCVSPGVYKIVIIPGTFVSAGYVEFRFIRDALFPTKVELDVQIKAGEKTVVGPETLPLGLLSFDREGIELDAQIHDFQTGDEVGHFKFLTSDRKYWIMAGTYKIVITNPYPGLTYENVEVKAGEETVLELPTQSSP